MSAVTAPPQDLAGLLPAALAAAFGEGSIPRYAPRQVFRWVYGHGVRDFARMTDLASALRRELAARFEFRFPEASERLTAADGTVRYVYRLDDGERVESVFIPGDEGQATLCLSSQVGCPLACTFCVSGVAGLRRNLTAGEIVGQALVMLGDRSPFLRSGGPGRCAPDAPRAPGPSGDPSPPGPRRRTNVVFMGMGEALLNLEAVTSAFTILADADGPAIPLRRMTVSTAGHVPAIRRFGALSPRPRLAVSLNAARDEVRSRIMPINRAWPIAELLGACRELRLAPGERITFEYVLLAGLNDGIDDARRLAALVRPLAAKVNLIPWNPSPGLDFGSPSETVVDRFAETLHRARVLVTVRRRRGADAGAACGQLALSRGDEASAREST